MIRLVFMVLAISLTLSAPAFAQSRDDLSKRQKVELIDHLDAGAEAYRAGNFEVALREFKAAYTILPDPGLHYRIALAYERLGRDKEAIAEYRTYLEKRPDAEKRGQIERTIALLEKAIAERNSVELVIRVEPRQATVRVFDEASGTLLTEGIAPLEATLEPIRVRVEAEASGHEPVSRVLELEPANDATISLELRPAARPTAERELFRPVLATTVAVALTAGTVISLLLYSSASDELDQFRATPQDFERSEAEEAASETNLYQGISWGLGAASVLAASWAVWEWTRSGETSTARIGLQPDGVRVTVDF